MRSSIVPMMCIAPANSRLDPSVAGLWSPGHAEMAFKLNPGKQKNMFFKLKKSNLAQQEIILKDLREFQ